MPLRAKIDSNMLPLAIQRTQSSIDDEVLFHSEGATQVVVLNRPKTLNAINENMVRQLVLHLLESIRINSTAIVILKGAGRRALSAGGDVKHLAILSRDKGIEAGGREATQYFGKEFGLNHLIATYPKPFVSFMDTIVMGGGVGVGAHASHRIGSAKTRIAMPETKIGYYPDVGGLWYLGRLDGRLGEYMALTSESLTGWTAYVEGLVSHYVPDPKLSEVELALSHAQLPNDYTSPAFFDQVDAIIEQYTQVPSDTTLQFSVKERQLIDLAFAHETVEAILAYLDDVDTEFAKKTAKLIRQRCPTSLKVALEALRRFRSVDFRSSLEIEANIASNFCYNPDFSEGVLALLVDKRPPVWSPARLEQVTPERVDSFFKQNKLGHAPVEFANTHSFMDYPHKYGLPSESEILQMIDSFGPNGLYKHMRPKTGLKEKVEWVLNRSI